MRDLNKVMVIGNVGRDPEMRFTGNGAPVTSFSLASSRVYVTPDGERRQETQWFDVVAWNKLAETCNQYLNKGKRVYVEGRLQSRTWEGSDGQRRVRWEIVANDVIFLDRKGAAVPGMEEDEGDIDIEDIPF